MSVSDCGTQGGPTFDCDDCPQFYRITLRVSWTDELGPHVVEFTACVIKAGAYRCYWFGNMQMRGCRLVTFIRVTSEEATTAGGRYYYLQFGTVAFDGGPEMGSPWTLRTFVSDEGTGVCPSADDWEVLESPPGFTDVSVEVLEFTTDSCPDEEECTPGEPCPDGDCEDDCGERIDFEVTGTDYQPLIDDNLDGDGTLEFSPLPDQCRYAGSNEVGLIVVVTCVSDSTGDYWEATANAGIFGIYRWRADNRSGCPPTGGWTLVENTVDSSTPTLTLSY